VVARPTRGLVLVVIAVAVLGVAVAGSSAASRAGETGKTQLGVLGSAERFQQLTGQRSAIRHVFAGWHQGSALPKVLENLRPIPMLAIKSAMPTADIAHGRGDDFLVQLNQAVAGFGDLVYVRPMPEMNGHWNEYCAFNKDGSSRGPRYSTAAFRKAFARIAVLARGGSAREMSAKLRKLGLPGVTGDLPRTKARIVWNPQGYGAPDIPANSAAAYYPGDAFVDVVANDLYLQTTGAAWEANEALYRAHPRKPYAIAEWGLWGIDDPSFVERMAAFVKTHPRVEFVAYFNSKPGSVWDLGSKPRSRSAYRRHITPLGR
jgi:hypothetical protein